MDIRSCQYCGIENKKPEKHLGGCPFDNSSIDEVAEGVEEWERGWQDGMSANTGQQRESSPAYRLGYCRGRANTQLDEIN